MTEPIVNTPPAEPTTPPAEPTTPPAEPKSFIEQIPEAFREKPWAKENAKDPDTFFKFVDNQNALIGKKGVIVPGDGATPEQMNEYLKAIGRPDSPDEYEFTPIEELKDTKRNAETEAAVKKLMHEVGIPKQMATKLQQGYEKMMYEQNKAVVDAQKAEDAAFEQFNKTFFGDKKETIVTNAQKVLRELDLPEGAKVMMDKMNSEQLAMVIAVTDGLYKKYGKEDGFRGGDPGAGPSTSESYDELSAKQRELMKQPGFDDWRHENHATLQAQNKVIMEKMRSIKK